MKKILISQTSSALLLRCRYCHVSAITPTLNRYFSILALCLSMSLLVVICRALISLFFRAVRVFRLIWLTLGSRDSSNRSLGTCATVAKCSVSAVAFRCWARKFLIRSKSKARLQSLKALVCLISALDLPQKSSLKT